MLQEHMKVDDVPDMRRPRRRPGEFRLKKSLGTRQGNRKDNFRLKRGGCALCFVFQFSKNTKFFLFWFVGMHLNSNLNPEYFEDIEYYWIMGRISWWSSLTFNWGCKLAERKIGFSLALPTSQNGKHIFSKIKSSFNYHGFASRN